MGKLASNLVLDALLDKIATSTQMIVTTSEPTDRADALSDALASVSLDSGDFTKADGSPNGRQVTITQQSNVDVTATGSATHVALVDGSDLLYATTVTAQTLTDGNTVTIPAWTVTIADPS